MGNIDNIKQHQEICDEIQKLYEAKNGDYGNAFDETMDQYGLIPLICILYHKVKRLMELTIPGKQAKVTDEAIRDTIKDISNYSMIGMMWLDRHKSNPNGKFMEEINKLISKIVVNPDNIHTGSFDD